MRSRAGFQPGSLFDEDGFRRTIIGRFFHRRLKWREEVVAQIRTEIANAQALLEAFDTPLEEAVTTSGTDPKIEQLYASVKELQRLYYESLIQALSLTAEIIEADGD